MAKTGAGLVEQICRLQKQLDQMRATAIPRMKKEIKSLGLTVEELFGTGSMLSSEAAPVSASASPVKRAQPMAGKKIPTPYADVAGNYWSGYGPKPAWFKAAIAAEISLDKLAELAVGGQKNPGPPRKVASKKTVNAP